MAGIVVNAASGSNQQLIMSDIDRLFLRPGELSLNISSLQCILSFPEYFESKLKNSKVVHRLIISEDKCYDNYYVEYDHVQLDYELLQKMFSNFENLKSLTYETHCDHNDTCRDSRPVVIAPS